MKNLIIIGAGDYAIEIKWLVERVNRSAKNWNLIGYVDVDFPAGTYRDGLPVLGDDNYLKNIRSETDVVFAIANCNIKKKIVQKLTSFSKVNFPAFIDPEAIVSEKATIREGAVISAGTILMPGVSVQPFANINLNCTVGHDSIIGAYSTIYPGCNISGRVHIGEAVEIGTGSKIIQGIGIESNTILGAGTVVIKDILQSGTYVGVPAKKMIDVDKRINSPTIIEDRGESK
jgi:sugar O-acyltransferase (sialic acid O-acetyltransferase NeuD family)